MTHASITLTGAGIQGSSIVEPFVIDVQAHIEIDAKTARRNATGWLVSEVGNMLIAGEPTLIIGNQTVWRMPILLTSTKVGIVNQVGTIDVSCETGDPIVDDEFFRQILKDAKYVV